MKMLVTAVALATLLVSPALAQTQPRPAAGKPFARVAPAPQPALETEEDSAYASYIGYGEVIENGVSVGRDPDPNVRLMLRRDQPGEQSGGSGD